MEAINDRNHLVNGESDSGSRMQSPAVRHFITTMLSMCVYRECLLNIKNCFPLKCTLIQVNFVHRRLAGCSYTLFHTLFYYLNTYVVYSFTARTFFNRTK